MWLCLLQADSQMSKDRQVFYDASLQYVFKIQEVQERKKFEFVEPVSTSTNIMVKFHFYYMRLCLYFCVLFCIVISLLLSFLTCWVCTALAGRGKKTMFHHRIRDWWVFISQIETVCICVHTAMFMKKQLKNSHYTQCLVSDENVLMIHISKAHFLLLLQHFLYGRALPSDKEEKSLL